MSDRETLEERLSAVERALTDGERDLGDLAAAADRAARLEELVERLDDVEDRVTELESATQALRGYVGNVRAVNRDVERRADAALAKVERLEHDPADAREDDGDRPPERRAFDGQQPERRPDDSGDGQTGGTGHDSTDRRRTADESNGGFEWNGDPRDGRDERREEECGARRADPWRERRQAGDDEDVEQREASDGAEGDRDGFLSGLRESL